MAIEATPPFESDEVEPGIATDKVCQIIWKARQFDVKEDDADPDSGSNASDDGMTDVLANKPNDPVYAELLAFIRALDLEEQVNLVALAWVGRGTYEVSEWQQALETARAEHNHRIAEYLLGLPLLGDYLEEGLAAFELDCADFNAQI